MDQIRQWLKERLDAVSNKEKKAIILAIYINYLKNMYAILSVVARLPV